VSARPSRPVDLGSTSVVAFERNSRESIITLKENINKSALGHGSRSARSRHLGSITAAGDADGDPNPARHGRRPLPGPTAAERAYAALKDLTPAAPWSTLASAHALLADLEEPRSPARAARPAHSARRIIREKSRMSGELILKPRHR